MKKTEIRFLWLFLQVAISSVAMDARADVFYQPPNSPIESEWRNAGSLFLEGIAQIMNGLAAIEAKDIGSAQSEMVKASASLFKAGDLYSNFKSEIRAPRTIAIDKVSPDRLKFMEDLFDHYKIKPPSNELEAAEIAGAQALQLANRLQSDKERLAVYKLENVQSLLNDVTRTLQIGTHISELLRDGLEEK